MGSQLLYTELVKNRLEEIDLLRGIAMVAMILIHATAYFLKDPLAKTLWDFSQFAVPVFLFCASYLFFKKTTPRQLHHFSSYISKRFVRLLKPYYIFLILYLLLLFVANPNGFSAVAALKLATLSTSGNDLSWLVLLFLQMSLVMPVVLFLSHKKKVLFYLVLFICVFISIVFLAYKPSTINFKLTMWITWTLIAIFASYFVKNEKKEYFLSRTLILTMIVFLGLNFALFSMDKSLLQYDNKYPPNLYHIAYGAFASVLLFLLARRGMFSWKPIRSLLHFLSFYSYSIYFIHFLILFTFLNFFKPVIFQLQWWGFFAVLIFLTIVGQKFLLVFTGARR